MKILAVDGEHADLLALLAAIGQAAPAAQLCGFRRAEEALAYMQRDPCDVAFLDIDPCGVDGIALAAQLCACNPQINIIFATRHEDYRAAAFALHASGYLLKPVTPEGVRHELDDLRRPIPAPPRLCIHTFGHFEALCGGVPLPFRYRKTRELLAYLVDRKGAMCSAGELIAVLFEGGDGHKAYYHRLRADLIGTLEACGCADALAQQRGLLGVRTAHIDCDYYRCLHDDRALRRHYRGEYMAQYSFAEVTNAELFARVHPRTPHL